MRIFQARSRIQLEVGEKYRAILLPAAGRRYGKRHAVGEQVLPATAPSRHRTGSELLPHPLPKQPKALPEGPMGNVSHSTFVPRLAPGTTPGNPPPPQRSRGASCRWLQRSPMSQIQSTTAYSSSWGREMCQHQAWEQCHIPAAPSPAGGRTGTWASGGHTGQRWGGTASSRMGTWAIGGDTGHRWGGTASVMAQRDRGWLRQTLAPAPCGGEGCRCRVVPQHGTGASTRAERWLSSLDGAAGDRVPRRGDAPHLSTLPAPRQAAPDHCSSPVSIAVPGSEWELNFRAAWTLWAIWGFSSRFFPNTGTGVASQGSCCRHAISMHPEHSRSKLRPAACPALAACPAPAQPGIQC